MYNVCVCLPPSLFVFPMSGPETWIIGCGPVSAYTYCVETLGMYSMCIVRLVKGPK